MAVELNNDTTPMTINLLDHMNGKLKWKYTNRSLLELSTVDYKLQILALEIADHIDTSILEGWRSMDKQEDLYRKGLTRVKSSKHNIDPAQAMDIAPAPIQWDNINRFYYFGGIVLTLAKRLGIPIRWGGDWEQTNLATHQQFNDLVHFELLT